MTIVVPINIQEEVLDEFNNSRLEDTSNTLLSIFRGSLLVLFLETISFIAINNQKDFYGGYGVHDVVIIICILYFLPLVFAFLWGKNNFWREAFIFFAFNIPIFISALFIEYPIYFVVISFFSFIPLHFIYKFSGAVTNPKNQKMLLLATWLWILIIGVWFFSTISSYNSQLLKNRNGYVQSSVNK